MRISNKGGWSGDFRLFKPSTFPTSISVLFYNRFATLPLWSPKVVMAEWTSLFQLKGTEISTTQSPLRQMTPKNFNDRVATPSFHLWLLYFKSASTTLRHRNFWGLFGSFVAFTTAWTLNFSNWRRHSVTSTLGSVWRIRHSNTLP